MADEQLSKKELRAQKHAEKAERKAEEARKAKRESFLQNIFIWSFVAILGAGLVLFVGNVLTSDPSDAVTEFEMPVLENDWIKGNPEAEVTVVEYADFQCPHCRDAVQTVNALLDTYGDDIRVVYRYFPLAFFKNSMTSARAAEAAGQQGKFFEMHDLLFENQSEWANLANPKDTFLGYAEELELDLEAFETVYEAAETEERIVANRDSGIEFGVTGTPTFFVNGTRVTSSVSALSQAIEAELASEEAPEAQEVPEGETEETPGETEGEAEAE
jgi:protein-disulfide isomerase